MRRASHRTGGRGGKRGKDLPKQIDDNHSRDIPSCQLIHEVAVDVFPEILNSDKQKSDTNEATIAADAKKKRSNGGGKAKCGAVEKREEARSPSIFGRLLRRHLLEQRKHERSSQTAGGKKKRRKKRKKAAPSSPPLPVGESSGEASQETAGHEEVARVGEASTPAENGLSTKTSSPAHKQIDEHAVMVERWLGRAAALETTRSHTSDQVDQTLLVNRDLAAFLKYLAKPASPTKKQTNSHLPGTPTISIADVQSAYDSIACLACRQSAEAYLRSMHLSPALDTVGKRTADEDEVDIPVPITLTQQSIEIPTGRLMGFPMMVNGERDIERAFDYHAMEEGLVDDDKRSSDSWKLSFRGPETSVASPVLNLMPEEITVSDVEQLVQTVLLPCGLPEVDDPNVYTLEDSQMQAIQTGAKTFSDEIIEQIHETGKKLQALRAIFSEIAGTTPMSEFDVSAATKLKDCDTRCDEVLEQLLMVLFRVSKEHFALSELSSEAWADGAMLELWETYKQTLSTIMEAEFLHVGAVVQLANRPGVVPQMFLSAKHRSSTLSMVSDKGRALAQLHEKMETCLLSPLSSDGQVPFLRKLLCYKHFCHIARAGKARQRKKDADMIDNIALRLLKDYTELTNTVYCVNVNGMVNKQTQRCDTVLELVKKFHEVLSNEEGAVKAEVAKDSLTTYSESMWKAQQLADANSNKSKKDEVVVESRQLYEYRGSLDVLVDNVMTRWRYVRSRQLLDDSEEPSPCHIPLRLSKWLRGTHDGRVPQRTNVACEGGCGERRVAGILGGLLYQWMMVRCNEWHAELAQTELLKAMDVALFSAPESDEHDKSDLRSAKPKRNKKKREKKLVAALTDNTPTDESVRLSPSEDLCRRKDSDVASVGNLGTDLTAEKLSSPSYRSPGGEDDNAGFESSLTTNGKKNVLVEAQVATEIAEEVGFTNVASKTKERRKVKAVGTVAQASASTCAAAPVGGARDSQGKHEKESPKVQPTEASRKSNHSAPIEVELESPESTERLSTGGRASEAEIASCSIGVLTATGIQSAESFLVERLVSALRERGAENNPEVLG